MNRTIDLQVPDEELDRILARLALGLNREEMRCIKAYFQRLNRAPSELELQALGQAWSEHCSYKTSAPLLRRYIIGIPSDTEIITMEDAGVVGLDDEFAYVVALESHNHPSAVEPYGGAATGVGGVIRDVLCMGALPIALIDGLFFASPATPLTDIPPGTKPPRYLMERVVQGISDYGNRMGIPTCAGMIAFHPGYLTNCLVNVGCIGIVRREGIVHSRVTKPGELLILAGGRTGRDGIHGANFASATLSEESETEDRSAVQLGDPITEEPLVHTCLEANQRGLVAGMKDLGAGGISGVVAEMVAAAGLGAKIDLDRVHLREDMDPWEIWISESQERMLLAVSPQHLPEIGAIFERWRVEYRQIGRVIEPPQVVVCHHGEEVGRLDTEFLLNPPNKKYRWKDIPASRSSRKQARQVHPLSRPQDYGKVLLDLLAGENIASRSFVIRQYDYEVGARTVTKPLQGKLVTHSPADAVIIKPRPDSNIGLAITNDVNPRFTQRDPFWGAAGAVDEVCRNLAAAGALPHSLADSLCLGDPHFPGRMEELEEVARGLNFVARQIRVPFVSGNVSLYNESALGPIPPTPVLLGVGIIHDIRNALTADLKEKGNLLFLIGKTTAELAGSEYLALLGEEGSSLPRVDPNELWRNCTAMVQVARAGVIRSAHDVSAGGIAVCLAELTFGGGIGCAVDLTSLAELPSEVKLFSESHSRFIVEVAPKDEKRFRAVFRECSVRQIGVTKGERIRIADSSALIDIAVEEARQAWAKGLTKYFREDR